MLDGCRLGISIFHVYGHNVSCQVQELNKNSCILQSCKNYHNVTTDIIDIMLLLTVTTDQLTLILVMGVSQFHQQLFDAALQECGFLPTSTRITLLNIRTRTSRCKRLILVFLRASITRSISPSFRQLVSSLAVGRLCVFDAMVCLGVKIM